ncbi:glycosyltransferase [Luedemannella flava]|uniref:glycosyltransferase n=1 Tax=Luedemannella flava TaxID=349316 RepID=UPI0031D26F26
MSTYPPTQCGLATFTSALLRGLTRAGSGVSAGVVRVVDSPVMSSSPEVVAQLRTRSTRGHGVAAEALNTFDVAVVQHEYGIYGGQDGDQVLSVLDEVRVPVVVVAHTVLARPTSHQRQVLEQVTRAAAAVVTMTHAARDRLVNGYTVNADKVVVIPHGAPVRSGPYLRLPGQRPLILTWGLLGPGKGIEWAIDAMHHVRRVTPSPAYIVAGQTHPRVRQLHGETYRLHLAERARIVGVTNNVRFEGAYMDEPSLTRLIRRADVVLLPYDSREQVTSGVLVEAVAAGIPVVATAFPHATELLSGGAGLVVPHGDSAAIGAALLRVLTEPGLAQQMSTEASRLSPTLLWPAVAARYQSLAAELLANRTVALG